MTSDETMPALPDGRRASDVIAETLIDEIKRGDIAMDEPLPTERELCERFDASRPTVRQALAQIQMRGYASGAAGRRPRARRPSLTSILQVAGDDIRQLLGDDESGAHLEQMRQFIETGAAREAARRADHMHIVRLRAALEKNHQAIGTPDFGSSDAAFHRALVAVIGNPIILTLHDMFVTAMLLRRPPNPDQVNYNQMVYEEHRALYQAVLGGDILTATEVMDRHLARSYRERLKLPDPDLD